MVDVEIYAWDNAVNPMAIQPDSTLGGANFSMCQTTVFIQDPDEVCPECVPEIDPGGLLVLNCDDDQEEGPTPEDDQVYKISGAGKLPFVLYQNKPNPFSDQTIIPFEIGNAGEVTLIIHDLNGRIIKHVQETFKAGLNEWKLDRSGLPSGILYYTIQTTTDRATKKMLIME